MPARGGETADGAFLGVSGHPTTQPRKNGVGETLRALQAQASQSGQDQRTGGEDQVTMGWDFHTR
jgi:hypothetical protein